MTPSDYQDHWRRQLRRQRAQLPTETLTQAADALFQRFKALPEQPKPGDKVSGYIAIRGEIDVQAILTDCHQRGCQIYLPILQGEQMFFAPWQPGCEIEKKGMGLLEPQHAPETRIRGDQLDWVLSPLVGFDVQGNRIGQGGGFYDRTFAAKHQHRDRAPYLLGVAHELQKLEHIQTQTWDVRLDAILTDRGHYPVHF